MIDIKLKRLSEDAIMPTYGSTKAACFDLYSNSKESVVRIPPHTTLKIGTGWSMQPINYRKNAGYVGLIFARSGIATKEGLRPANCVGVVDEDYTGEIIVALHNDTDEDKYIKKGQRIAQMTYIPFEQPHLIEVEDLEKTERNSGGFGSTGI